MAYESVDKLQKVLTEEVFDYAKDSKKAAGRALGTVVETLTFYLLESWGLRDALSIEERIPEYGNPEITHNVEFSLHPVLGKWAFKTPRTGQSLTANRILKSLAAEGIDLGITALPGQNLLSSKGVMRNGCKVALKGETQYIASLDPAGPNTVEVVVVQQSVRPYAMFECKRVGVEEGMKKGPQTIEKAKQGAYVARMVSSLQKIRGHDGSLRGVWNSPAGDFLTGDHPTMLGELIEADDPDSLRGFVLTVGVVSNHGNWFTQENHNKELKVLAQSYDWLLFLTDAGLTEFIAEVMLDPTPANEPIADAFRASYGPESGPNMFTKIKMEQKAHIALLEYFVLNAERVLGWFNVISPTNATIASMRDDLTALAAKDWEGIHA